MEKTSTIVNNIRDGEDSCRIYICTGRDEGKEWSGVE
jgi:hypothetical protein